MQQLDLVSRKQYPTWHKKPFHLSIGEIENPHLALQEIFRIHDLPSLRYHLTEWLTEAFSVHLDIPAAIDVLEFYKDVVKLVEAAWVLHEEYNKTHPAEGKAKGQKPKELYG